MDFHRVLRARLESGEEIEESLPQAAGFKEGSGHVLSDKTLAGPFCPMGEKVLNHWEKDGKIPKDPLWQKQENKNNSLPKAGQKNYPRPRLLQG